MAEREDALEKSMGISEILYKVLVVGNFGVGEVISTHTHTLIMYSTVLGSVRYYEQDISLNGIYLGLCCSQK